jgi:tRNA A-37 threonylcarbamoyl transferase component Bud32
MNLNRPVVLDLVKLINPYRSQEFTNSIRKFFDNEVETHLEKYFLDKAVDVTPLSNGSVGAVFLLKCKEKCAILKIIDSSNVFNHYWAEQAGYIFSSKAGIRTPTVYLRGELSEYSLCYELLEKIDHPVLSDFLSTHSDNTNWINDLAYNLSNLHKIKIDGYSEFQFGELIPKKHQIDQKEYILNDRLNPELLHYFYENKILEKRDIEELYKRANDLIFDQKNSVIHGDFHASNIFFDDKKSQSIFYDFKSTIADPLFDLGRLRHSLVAQGYKNHWENFKKAYQVHIHFDENRLNTFSMITMLRDIKSDFADNNIERFQRLINDFKSMI